MALKPSVHFKLRVLGDGTDTSIAVLVATAPFFLLNPTSEDGFFSPTFSLSSSLPSDMTQVTADNGMTIASASLGTLNTILTVNFTTALGAGAECAITGTFLF
jgi:hypothetical protein